MATFDIANYKVTTDLQRFGTGPTETRRTRSLELVSEPVYHGIVLRATIAFSTTFDSWSGSPVVGYYGAWNPSAPVIAGWFPVSEFPTWLDIVRNERPVKLIYEFQAAGTTSGYLTYLAVGTGAEPIGEGPADASYPRALTRIPQFDAKILDTAVEGLAEEVEI